MTSMAVQWRQKWWKDKNATFRTLCVPTSSLFSCILPDVHRRDYVAPGDQLIMAEQKNTFCTSPTGEIRCLGYWTFPLTYGRQVLHMSTLHTNCLTDWQKYVIIQARYELTGEYDKLELNFFKIQGALGIVIKWHVTSAWIIGLCFTN